MKYVTFDSHNGEEIIIFPRVIQHSSLAAQVTSLSFGGMRPISAGFVEGGQCIGESLSLRMKSRGDIDTALIAKLLDMDTPKINTPLAKLLDMDTPKINTPLVKEEGVRVRKPLISKNKAKALRKKGKPVRGVSDV
jgi:hypothetical protein